MLDFDYDAHVEFELNPLGAQHDTPPFKTITCPLCSWRVRVHEKDVKHNLIGHLEDCK